MIVTTEQIPPNLSTPAFIEAWGNWRQHRKEIKHPLTPMSAKMQLKKLAEWGEAKAIESIETSIMNGWVGVFPPKTFNATFKGTVSLGNVGRCGGGL